MSNRKRLAGNAPGGAMSDVLDDLKKEGHISDRQYLAGLMLLKYLQDNHGSSDGLIGQIQERVQSSTRERLSPPGGGNPDSFEKLVWVFRSLHEHERRFFEFMVRHRELPRGSLSDWGRLHSGFKTNKTSRAATVGVVVSFLNSVAELCLPPVPS